MQFATVFTPFRRLCAIIVNHLEQRGEEASSGLISFEPSSTRSDAKFIIADEPGGGGSGMRRRNAENRMGSILIQHAKLSRYTESDISSMIILASPRCSSPQLLQPCSEMHPRIITSHRQLFVCLLLILAAVRISSNNKIISNNKKIIIIIDFITKVNI